MDPVTTQMEVLYLQWKALEELCLSAWHFAGEGQVYVKAPPNATHILPLPEIKKSTCPAWWQGLSERPGVGSLLVQPFDSSFEGGIESES